MHPIPIIRRYPTTDQTAPWDGIVFTFRVGTDELNEALKASFPRYRTLRERKCAAAIAFFEQELNEMQSVYAATTPAKTPPRQDLPRPVAHTSTCDGGQLGDSNAPPPSPASSLNSSAPQDSDMQYSAAQASSLSSLADPTDATSSTHLVFNAFDGRPIQQKTKRKMTPEEKQEYKRTRQRGACARCKRQKGKCTHINDAHLALIDANGLTENFQRLETDTGDSNSSRLDRVESVVAYSRDPNTFQQPDMSSPLASRRSSNASNRSQTTPNQPAWQVATGTELDMSGYVNQTPSYQQNHSSFPDHHLSPYWPDYNQIDNQDQSTFQGSPSIYIQGPESEASFPSAYPFNQWSQGYSEDTGMT